MRHRLSRTFRRFGRWVLENPSLTESINDQMVLITYAMSAEIRETVSRHIVYTVTHWDNRSMVRELELSIGRDLQFIRINGTLVGGLIGVLLHALVLLLSMRFSFCRPPFYCAKRQARFFPLSLLPETY